MRALSAHGAGRRLTLAAPATLTYGSDGLDIKNLALRVDAGRLSLSGHAGSDARPSGRRAVGLPLTALDIFSPGLGLVGVADGEATIGGTPNNPTGDWRVRLEQRERCRKCATQVCPRWTSPAPAGSAGGRTSLDVTVNAGTGNAVRLTGSAPLAPDGALDVKIDGALDARLANTMLSVSGRHAAGSLAIALQLRGTIAKPQAQGVVRLTGGEFRDDQTGFKLTAITGTLIRRTATRFGSIASQGQRRTPARSRRAAK